MMRLPEIEKAPEPVGKRTLRANVWGNLNGYVSGRFWLTFGPTYGVGVQAEADEWKAGEIMPPKKQRAKVTP